MLKCLYVLAYAVGIIGWMAFSAFNSPAYPFHFMSLVTLSVWCTIGGRVHFPYVAIGACYLDKGWSDDEFSGESDELIISLVTQVVLSVDGSNWRDEGKPLDIDMAAFNTRCEKLKLTPRERQLAPLVIRGFSKRKICNKLFISVNTLRTHLKNINSKAGVKKRSDLLHLLTGDAAE